MKHKPGFTLMEMLVIVGAIGILSAIAYPAVTRSLEQNREAADVAAMQSADALITSAAISGRIVDGFPASRFSQEAPLYYDGSGDLTNQLPAPYGQGTPINGGKTWNFCADAAYEANADYTGSVICCWYDSATRQSHVHWTARRPGQSTPCGRTERTIRPPKVFSTTTSPTCGWNSLRNVTEATASPA